MRIAIAKSFDDALSRMEAKIQTAAKGALYDFQVNPDRPSLNMERIKSAKGLWSIRSSDAIRIILFREDDLALFCYVDSHDKAYEWARTHRVTAPADAAVAEIIEVRERIETVTERSVRGILESVRDKDLVDIGVPRAMVETVKTVPEGPQFDLLLKQFSQEISDKLIAIALDIPIPKMSARRRRRGLTLFYARHLELMRERTRDALHHLRSEGIALGQVPLGYRRSAGGKLERDEDEAATVARARELAQTLSLREVAATLTGEGRRTKRGGAWYASTVRALIARSAAP